MARTKRHDFMAHQVAKLVIDRPWLGWRHRQPMEAYTASRRRNALFQVGMNGFFLVFNLITGAFLAIPMMVLVIVQMVRTHRKLGADPSGHQAEWQEIRDALVTADEAHLAGNGRRLPSPLSLAIIPMVTVGMAVLTRLLVHAGSWSIWIIGGLAVGLLLDAADVVLHRRYVPQAPAVAAVAASPTVELPAQDEPVIDLVAAEAELTNEAPTISAVPESWDGVFPIDDYDRLTVNLILPLLPKLYRDELALVEERELAGKARRTVLARLAQLEASSVGAPEDMIIEEWLATTRNATRVLQEVGAVA